ncbi:hypothetical protein BKA93DRAFT_299875 [Sparassis latifolia]
MHQITSQLRRFCPFLSHYSHLLPRSPQGETLRITQVVVVTADMQRSEQLSHPYRTPRCDPNSEEYLWPKACRSKCVFQIAHFAAPGVYTDRHADVRSRSISGVPMLPLDMPALRRLASTVSLRLPLHSCHTLAGLRVSIPVAFIDSRTVSSSHQIGNPLALAPLVIPRCCFGCSARQPSIERTF